MNLIFGSLFYGLVATSFILLNGTYPSFSADLNADLWTISDDGEFKPRSGITDEQFEIMVKTHPNMTRLDLSEQGNITDRSLRYLSTHARGTNSKHTALTELSLVDTTNITTKGVNALVKRSPLLVDLSFSEYDVNGREGPLVTEELIDALVRSTPDLRTLSLFDCMGVSKDDIVRVITKCKQLTSFTVEGCKSVNALNEGDFKGKKRP